MEDNDRRAKVFLAVPFYQSFPGEAINNTEGCCAPPTEAVIYKHGEAFVERNFSNCWAEALNSREQERWTHFGMIHVDIEPTARRWLDLLLLEMRQTGADLLSVVLPIKTSHGLTSTAILSPDRTWRRLTMHEVDAIPDMSFDAEGAGFPGCQLLASTGLWIADFTQPWVEEVWFETRCRIVNRGTSDCTCGHPKEAHEGHTHTIGQPPPTRCSQGCGCLEYRCAGKFEVESFPEDWHFSKMLHARGLKVMATKLLSCNHWGMAPYPNDRPWGTVKTDTWHEPCKWLNPEPKHEEATCLP